MAPISWAAPPRHGASCIERPSSTRRLEAAGHEVTGTTPSEFDRQLPQRGELYRKLTAQAGINPD
jgi:hypothetical protein